MADGYPKLLWHVKGREYLVTNRDEEAELRDQIADLVETPPVDLPSLVSQHFIPDREHQRSVAVPEPTTELTPEPEKHEG